MNCDPEKRRMEAALVQSEGEQEGGEKEYRQKSSCSPPESQNANTHLSHVLRDATKNMNHWNANSIHITSTF